MTIKKLEFDNTHVFIEKSTKYMDERVSMLTERLRVISNQVGFDFDLYLINNTRDGVFKNKPPLERLRILKGAIMPLRIWKNELERKRQEVTINTFDREYREIDNAIKDLE